MKKINAKFNSKCAETGKKILKGEEMYYDYGAKKCYCLASDRAKLEAANAGTESAANNDSSYVQAQEDAYLDNRYSQSDNGWSR